MTNLVPTPGMDDVPQIETTTRALGGAGQPANLQAQALLNRTAAIVSDLANSANPAKGAALVGYDGGTVLDALAALETALVALGNALNFSALPSTTDPTGMTLVGTQTGVTKQINRDTLVGAKPITYTGGGATLPYVLSGVSVGAGIRNFNVTASAAGDVQIDGRQNFVVMMGHNQTTGGARQDPTDGTLHISFEQHWNQGGIPAFEWHLQSMDTGGTVHRPITAFLPKSGGAGSSIGFSTDRLYSNNYAGLQRLNIDFASNYIEYPNGHIKIRVANNVNLGEQRNAANNAYLALPYLGADDRLRMEQSTVMVGPTPSTGSYPDTFAVMQATTLANNGTVLNLKSPVVTGSIYMGLCVGQATDDVKFSIFNNTNAATANAVCELRAVGTAAGDPFVRYIVNSGGATWAVGVDNSDSDSFVFSAGNVPGTNNRAKLTTAGKLLLTDGLGVGNSVAATTVGTLSRKMEVFDAAGASLGFVPIYATIS